MEVEAAVRRLLLSDSTVNGYVVGKVYKYRLMESVQSGGRAVVVKRDGGWSKPNRRGTAEFPLLLVQCWADVDRGPDGEMTTANAEEKAWALWRVVNRLLHGARGEMWGASVDNDGLMVVTCERWSEPIVSVSGQMHNGDPDKALIGEGALLSVKYALEIAPASSLAI